MSWRCFTSRTTLWGGTGCSLRRGGAVDRSCYKGQATREPWTLQLSLSKTGPEGFGRIDNPVWNQTLPRPISFNPHSAAMWWDFFFFGCTMQHVGSWFPDQGLNWGPPAVDVWSLNHWIAREVPEFCFPSWCFWEKAMAPHSSTLAWKIPWTVEPGGLQSMGVTKSQTRLSDFAFSFDFHALEKEMATHSSVLA